MTSLLTNDDRLRRLRALAGDPPARPGAGETAERHRRLTHVGREDLGLARLIEAHWDAVAILEEAGRLPAPGKLYGVWASEIPGRSVCLEQDGDSLRISGTKLFCSGATIADRALITVTSPRPLLVDVDLRAFEDRVSYDESQWSTEAFRETHTASVTFHDLPVRATDIVGPEGWYLTRTGFWQGACGPAACWAGGALGLIDFALEHSRADTHTLAHKGALYAAGWTLEKLVEAAGDDIDQSPGDSEAAQRVALSLRHVVEITSTDVLRRISRALGPHPMCMNAEVSRRMLELDLYLRQSHAERDLEALGRLTAKTNKSAR